MEHTGETNNLDYDLEAQDNLLMTENGKFYDWGADKFYQETTEKNDYAKKMEEVLPGEMTDEEMRKMLNGQIEKENEENQSEKEMKFAAGDEGGKNEERDNEYGKKPGMKVAVMDLNEQNEDLKQDSTEMAAIKEAYLEDDGRFESTKSDEIEGFIDQNPKLMQQMAVATTGLLELEEQSENKDAAENDDLEMENENMVKGDAAVAGEANGNNAETVEDEKKGEEEKREDLPDVVFEQLRKIIELARTQPVEAEKLRKLKIALGIAEEEQPVKEIGEENGVEFEKVEWDDEKDLDLNYGQIWRERDYKLSELKAENLAKKERGEITEEEYLDGERYYDEKIQENIENYRTELERTQSRRVPKAIFDNFVKIGRDSYAAEMKKRQA